MLCLGITCTFVLSSLPAHRTPRFGAARGFGWSLVVRGLSRTPESKASS